MRSALGIDIKMSDGTGVADFTYLANDNLETIDGPLAGDKLTYHYNALGNLIDITPEQGQVVSYKYDYDTNVADIDLGRLKSIATGTNTFTYDYDGVNPLIQKLTRPNGSYTEYQYNDPLKRLTALINKASAGSLINSFAYTYDKDLIKTETITNGTIIDNFLEKTTTYQPNAVNQLLSATTQGVAKNYAYDNDGNMTTGYTPADKALTMTYDAENRMKTAQYTDGTPPNEITHLFEYGYAGTSLLDQLVKKENGTPVSTTKYLRSGFLPVQERDGSNAITREYTWGKNLGGGIGGLLNLKQKDTNDQWRDYSYLYDGKGNVSALIGPDQIPVATYAYDPFGMLMKNTSATGFDQPYKFSTKPYFSDMGQSDFGYRYYDACSGKWTTMDPLGEEGGINLYRFNRNSALNYIDPTGLIPLDTIWDLGNIIYDIFTGDWESLTWDTGALLIPYIPAGVTKAAKIGKICKTGRGFDDILSNNELFKRWLRHKHPANEPYSPDNAKKIWGKIKESGLTPRLDPGHQRPGSQWTGPHINVEGTDIHIPVDPRFKP